MIAGKKVVCVIPARLKSTRFPRKMLATLGDKPLIQWVWEAAKNIPIFDSVSFAIDSEETAAVIKSFGGNYHMTSVDCLTGTDRLVELIQNGKLSGDIWVNWQGDEPFISLQLIQDLLQSCNDDADVWTIKKRITSHEDIHSPHVGKVVCDNQGFALYFSRCPIPYYRDTVPDSSKIYFKHIGMYAFSEAALKKIAGFSPSYLEEAEQLEQLRFLSNGLRIRVHETKEEAFGIDLPEHLAKAESMIARRPIV
jgi:3-deoxy-manno-octulosonate cytidylyltransferase (CMP-KDO synthetase)